MNARATRRTMLAVAALAVLAGGATAPEVRTIVEPGVDLARRVQVTSYPAMGWGAHGYDGYRWGVYGGWPMHYDDVYTYQEGTVGVDLVDAARKQLVWEGLVVGAVTSKELDQLQASLERAVQLAFAKFPLAPPPAVPAPAAR